MQTSRRSFLKTAGALSMLTLMGTSASCSKKSHPNILIIFSDELTHEYLSCYGGDIKTPHLDHLASTGMRFTQAYASAPQCTPSRFSILTGTYSGKSTHPSFLKDYPTDTPYMIGWNTYITKETPTLPRLLSQNGYITGMAGKVHFAKLSTDVQEPPIDAHADLKNPETEKYLQNRQQLYKSELQKQAGFDECHSITWDNMDHDPVLALRHHNFPWITKGAVDFMDKHAGGDKPFFLYVATTAVHGPAHQDMWNHDLRYTPEGYLEDVSQYQIPQKEIAKKLTNEPEWRQHRVAGMACVDNHVKLLLDKLKEKGVADNTIVIFMADHNIEPGKAVCYQKGFVAPAIIRWPGKTQAGSVSHSLIQNIDFMPTLLKAAGAHTDVHFDGKDIAPILENAETAVRDYIYLECGYARGITDGKYKYIAVRYPKPIIDKMINGETEFAPNYMDIHKQAHSQIAIEHYPGYFDPDQFYDLEKDPYEQKNVADTPEYAELMALFKAELQKKLDTFDHPYSLEDIPFMTTKRYKKLAKNTRDIGTDYISWLPRDHGKIVWPPKK